MKVVYQNKLVDLKIVETESNTNTFYQVWKDGIICKQSDSYDHCSTYANDLISTMVEDKLEDLKANVYYAGQAYLLDHDDEYQNLVASCNYNKAQQALNHFKSLLEGNNT